MELTNDEIKHIAKLSRLKVSDEEIPEYREKLASILEYVAQLQSVDTTGASEAVRGLENTNVFRDDVIEACDPDVRKRLVDAFPRREGDLLEVQAVFESK